LPLLLVVLPPAAPLLELEEVVSSLPHASKAESEHTETKTSPRRR